MTSSPLSLEERGAAEMQLLQFLCDAAIDLASRRKLARMLGACHWSSQDHIVLFECISELLARDPRHILEHLPAALTRRGFPDMPWESLAAPAKLRPKTALALAKSLLHLTR